jgi:hypothetical protein
VKNRTLIGSAIALLVGVAIACAGDFISKYSTAGGGATRASATAIFGPGQGRTIVRSIQAETDLQDGAIKFYARSGGRSVVSAVSADALTCTVVNTGGPFAPNDLVVYVYDSGVAPQYRTVSATSAVAVVLSSALTGTTSTKDTLYEVAQLGQILVGKYGTGIGTNDTYSGTDVFATPSRSPLYVVVNGNSNAAVNITVEQ